MSPSANDILEAYTGRIVALVQQATREEHAAGMVWYPAFGSAIAEYGALHGLAREQSLALFAALSPLASIQRNWDNFKRCCETHTTIRCVCLTNRQRRKVATFLAGQSSVEAVTAGDKVSAFYANLAGNLDRVTIDRHAMAVCLGYAPPRPRISHTEYRTLTLAYQAAAKLLDIQPAQVQAIAWIVWRRLKGIKDEGGLSLIRP